MNIVQGSIKKIDNQLTLDLKLDDLVYKKLKEQVVNNMFLGVRRTAARFRRIALRSIGDNLNKEGVQHHKEIEFYLEIEILSNLKESEINELKNSNLWKIRASSNSNKLASFEFTVDRDSEFILDRKYNE